MPVPRGLHRVQARGVVPILRRVLWLLLSGSSSLQPYQYDNSAPEERGGRTGIGHRPRKRERPIESRRRVAAHDVHSDSRPVWVKICIADPGLKIGEEGSTGNDGPL